MKQILLINGSPKINEKSTSAMLLEQLKKSFAPAALTWQEVSVRQCASPSQRQNAFKSMSEADVIVVAYPLYHFCLPGVLMKFLEESQETLKSASREEPILFYALVNCGFPEVSSCREPARVLRSFCRQVGGEFRFSILISGGPFLLEMGETVFMRGLMHKVDSSLAVLAREIESGSRENKKDIELQPKMPKKLYLTMLHQGWIQLGKENGLKKKDLLMGQVRQNKMPAPPLSS